MKSHHSLRALFCLLLCLVMVLQPLSVIPVQAAETTELIKNGTFADSDKDGKADGWSYYSTTANPEAKSEVGEDGITITGENGKRLTVHQTKYNLTPGKTYHLSFRYRVSSYSSQNMQTRCIVGGTTYVIAQTQAVTDGWVQVDKDITLPDNATSIKVEFALDPNAVLTCSIDDVSLTEGAAPVAAPAGTSLLKNGTFADGENKDGKADNWTYYYNDGTRSESKSELNQNGITITATFADRLTVHQTANVEVGKTYLLMFRYDVSARSKGYLEIRYNAGGSNNISLLRGLAVSGGWQTFAKEIVPTSNKLKVEFVVGPNADMTCSIGDVYLVEVVEEEPEPPVVQKSLNTLLLNGTFLDTNSDNKADSWNYYVKGATVAETELNPSGGIKIIANTDRENNTVTHMLTLHQTVSDLDPNKVYRITGDYHVVSTNFGSLEIRHNASTDTQEKRLAYETSKTNGWQSFDKTITGVDSVKIEVVVSMGAILTCEVNNFKLEEVPNYTVSFDPNGGTGTMEPKSTAGAYTLPECGFTAPQNTFFKGWDMNGTVHAAGTKITVTSDVTLKAVWGDNNLLLNPEYDFEEISSIPGWNYYPAYDTSKYTAAVVDGVFTGTVLGNSNLILHQTVKMTDATLNKTYRFTADIKTENISGYAMFKIYLQYGNEQLHSYSSAQYKGNTEWTTVTFNFDVPAVLCGDPVDAIKLEQYILNGTGSASFRNVSIRPVANLEVLEEGDPVHSLVLNGGFEYTLSGAPAKWNLWLSTGGLNVASDREVVKEGYSSLHLSNVTSGSDSRGSVYQTFTITEELQELWGQSVKVGLWVQTKDFAGDALAVRVHYAAVSGSYLSKSLPVDGTQEWTYYEYIIDLPNTKFETLKVEVLYDYAQGDVWIDNLTCNGYIKAKSLTLSAKKVVLTEGGTQDLTVSFTPANTTIRDVTWASSNPAVATVANGEITAKAPGFATITVTHVDGMKKEIAVLVADSEMSFDKPISIETKQNTSKSGILPEGYSYQVAANPQFGTILVEGGVYTYFPAKDFSDTDSVTLLVSSDAGQCLVVVPLTVTAVNGAPEFGKMTIITKVGESVNGAFSATDPENDTLNYAVVQQPKNGTVTVSGNTYIFTPNAGFTGYDTVTFSVTDVSQTVQKEVTVYVAPSPDDLLDTVKEDHARLLADDARFEELKGLIPTDENAKAWFAIVKRDADKLLSDSTPVPYQCPDGVRLDTQGSKDVLNLAFMYRMTDEQVYLDRAKLELLYLCGLSEDTYPDWHPSHLLDTAMTANGVAIAYDWLYDTLTANEKAQVEKAIYQNALVEARKQFETNHMFATNTENWNYICNGGFITAALALAHNEKTEYHTLAGEIMQRCYASIQYGLPQYAPEGASIEGISYWDYGTRYLVSLLASISSATTNNPFLNTPGLNVTAEYPIYLSGKAGSYNYSDNDMVDAYGYLNMWFAHTYGDHSWNWYHKYYMEKDYDPTVYDLLYYYPAEYGGDAPAKLDKFYTNQAVTTMRHDFTDPMSSFLGFKGGLNGAPHGDVDIGSFIYDIYGYRWAEDFGKDDYNLTGYWEIAPGGTRWNYYRKNAMGHNTLVFNPTKGANQTVGAYAGKTEQVLNEENGGYTILDMTDAYQENAVSVKRGFAYFDRTQVLIRDEFTLKAPGTAYWQMHTKASVDISKDGKTATLTQGEYRIQLKLVGENAEDGLKFESMAATTYEGVEYEGLKSNEDYTKVYVKAAGVQKAVFNVLITPVDMATPEVKALKDWNQYVFYSAKIDQYSISLKGNISINFYTLLSEKVLSDESACMQFTMADGEVIQIPVKNAVKRDDHYVFSCGVAAKEMTDVVKAQVIYSGGSSKEFSCSVKGYADYLLKNHTNTDVINLVTAMLHYGAASQIHFDYKTKNLANAGLQDPESSNVDLESITHLPNQGTNKAKFTSASLILKSETALRFFFDSEIVSVTYGDRKLEVKQRGNSYYVDVVGISAKDLDEDVTITINDGEETANVTYNPMAYCKTVLNGDYDSNLKNLVTTLYLYNQAANIYLEEN